MPIKAGRSFDEDIRALNEHVPLVSGEVIKHETIAAAVGINDTKSPRYRGLISAWRRHLARFKGIELSGQGRAHGIGLLVCKASDQIELRKTDHVHLDRKVRRIGKKVEMIDATSLDERGRGELMLVRRATDDLRSATKAARKILREPPAVEATNVRVFQKL